MLVQGSPLTARHSFTVHLPFGWSVRPMRAGKALSLPFTEIGEGKALPVVVFMFVGVDMTYLLKCCLF